MNIQSIGAGIGNFGLALGEGIKTAADKVGSVAIKILSNLPWGAGEQIGSFLAKIPTRAVGGIAATLILGALVGTVLLVTKVVIPLFHKEATEA